MISSKKFGNNNNTHTKSSRQSTTPPQPTGRHLSGEELEPFVNQSSLTSYKEAKEKSLGATKAAYDETKSSSSFTQNERNDDDDLTSR